MISPTRLASTSGLKGFSRNPSPGANSGVDVKPNGTGAITNERLYQLVRHKGEIRDRTFRIEFLDPGVEAFAFTFG